MQKIAKYLDEVEKIYKQFRVNGKVEKQGKSCTMP
jgi:hypothetical protein